MVGFSFIWMFFCDATLMQPQAGFWRPGRE